MHTRSHEKWIKKLNEWCVLCVLRVCARACERMISFHFKEAHFEQSKTTDSTQITTTTREKERKNERTKKQMSIPREWSENRSLNVVFPFFRLCFFNRCMHIWTLGWNSISSICAKHMNLSNVLLFLPFHSILTTLARVRRSQITHRRKKWRW